jgi:hypothetical protein
MHTSVLKDKNRRPMFRGKKRILATKCFISTSLQEGKETDGSKLSICNLLREKCERQSPYA